MEYWTNYRETSEERLIRQTLEALLYEELVDWSWAETSNHSVIQCYLGDLQIESHAIKTAFGRIYLCPGTITHSEGNQLTLSDLKTHLSCSREIIQELENTITNTDLVTEFPSIQKYPNRRNLSYRELECFLHEGHPYHPCFKSRMGFSEQDQRLYSPESGAEFSLHYLAIDACLLEGCIRTIDDIFWQNLLDEKEIESARKQLQVRSSCGIVPVHPWQWKQIRNLNEIRQLLSRRQIVSLGKMGCRFSASQSLRTLIPVQDRQFPHMKFPMNLVNTSSLRTLDEVSVLSAEILSDWLLGVVRQDSFLSNGTLKILREHSGVMLTSSVFLQGQLGYLLRESVESSLQENERAIPANAFANIESDGKPFVDDWIQCHGFENWFKQWIRIAVLPQWHLLLGYGIASEWHAQNTIVVVENGWPVRLMLRDFHDGLEYVASHLPTGIREPNFRSLRNRMEEAHAHYRANDFESTKDLAFECLFVFNLSDILKLFSVSYGVEDLTLWNWVREIMSDHLSDHPILKERYAIAEALSQSIKVESLFEKKLKPKLSTGFYHHQISNPLFQKNHVLR